MNNLSFTLPEKYDWVDTTNPSFLKVLEEIVLSKSDIFCQGRAGTGKSLLIKILSEIKKNVVVLSTTGLTAMALSSDNIAAKTLHSFFSIEPREILDITYSFISPKNARLLKAASCIVIDEVSMMSNQLFDYICEKIEYVRGNIPRMILFGDVMQLPPVIDMNNQIVKDFYQKKYDGNVMFFNSEYYKQLKFKQFHLRKSYRQPDAEFSNRLLEIGYKDHGQDTLDYFNQQVMSLPQYETKFQQYMYMSPTNLVVNKMNNEYIQTLKGKSHVYKATKSQNWPKGQTPTDETIEIKEGAQVMCTMNHYSPNEGSDYRNGTIGTAIKVDPNFVEIELPNGNTTRVQRSTLTIHELELDSGGNIYYKPKGWYNQIDCKVCKAVTTHKSQGKTFNEAYFAPGGWTPPGLVYVALSRLSTLDGLGLARPLVMNDIKINEESYEFLTGC